MTGNGIQSITKTGTSGLVDTYTITYTNGNTTTFTVTNGEDGEVTQAQFDDLQQRVEDAEKNQLTNTPEKATSHYLQDSADSRFRKFIPIGRTTQESTSGKQLFDKSTIANGAIFRSNGNIDSDTLSTHQHSDYIEIEESTQYYATIKTFPSSNYGFAFYDNSKAFISSIASANLITTPATAKYVRICWAKTGTYANDVNTTQVEKGSTATDYEPYTGGIPAPNPNYPYAIKNTGDNVNLFDKSQVLQNYELRGISAGDEKGQTQPATGWYVSDFIEVKQNTTYYLSGNKTTGSANALYDENKNCISIITAIKGAITTIANTKYIRFNGKLNELDNNIKFEEGTQATPYSPYGCGNVNEKVQNKNLFDGDVLLEADGWTKDNGVYTGNLNAWYLAFNEGFGNLQFKENTQYTLSFKGMVTSGSPRYRFVYEDDTYSTVTINSSTMDNYSLISTAGKTVKKLIANYGSGSAQTLSFSEIILNEGATAQSYIAHSEQNISFPLAEGQKFYEGSYPDDDEKVHHKWGEVDLSTLNWVFRNTNEDGLSTFSAYLSDRKYGNDFAPLCDYLKFLGFKYVAQMYSLDEGFAFYYDSPSSIGTSIYINVKVSQLSELQTWLQEKHPKLLYPLAEEQTEDFTEEQKTAWEEWKKSRTYKNVTHISSEDETPANVEVEYVRDLETVINNLSN